MNRRQFFERMGGWSLATLLSAVAARADDAPYETPGFLRKPVPGACLQPGTDTEKTLAAVLDAIVPGPTTDPEGTAGAVEACSLNVLLDATFPFLHYADMFATIIDGQAQDLHGAPFLQLTQDQRVDVLVAVQDTVPLLRLAYRAIRSAFFGGAYNGIGLDYVGYPGPNLGYRHVPEFSFRAPVCQELTADGRMP